MAGAVVVDLALDADHDLALATGHLEGALDRLAFAFAEGEQQVDAVKLAVEVRIAVVRVFQVVHPDVAVEFVN